MQEMANRSPPLPAKSFATRAQIGAIEAKLGAPASATPVNASITRQTVPSNARNGEPLTAVASKIICDSSSDRSHRSQIGRARFGDSGERVHYAPDRAEQCKKWRTAHRRCQQNHLRLELRSEPSKPNWARPLRRLR